MNQPLDIKSKVGGWVGGWTYMRQLEAFIISLMRFPPLPITHPTTWGRREMTAVLCREVGGWVGGWVDSLLL